MDVMSKQSDRTIDPQIANHNRHAGQYKAGNPLLQFAHVSLFPKSLVNGQTPSIPDRNRSSATRIWCFASRGKGSQPATAPDRRLDAGHDSGSNLADLFSTVSPA
jgi:hypothetical protein